MESKGGFLGSSLPQLGDFGTGSGIYKSIAGMNRYSVPFRPEAADGGETKSGKDRGGQCAIKVQI